MKASFRAAALTVAALALSVSAQSFQRLGSCPTLGCVFPPDQVDHLAGQYFDIRVEVHAPQNGSEATAIKTPDPNFQLTITEPRGQPVNVSQYFKLSEPALERWSFSYYQDYFAQDAKAPTPVNVTSKVWRRVALYKVSWRRKGSVYTSQGFSRMKSSKLTQLHSLALTPSTWPTTTVLHRLSLSGTSAL